MSAPTYRSDYVRSIAEYFIDRRGRGTAISSADLDLIHDWERADTPLSVVLAGIDRAFDRRAKAPASLGACRVHVNVEAKAWLTAREGHAPPRKANTSGAYRAAESAEPQPADPGDALLALAEQRILDAPIGIARDALQEIVEELRDIKDSEGKIDAATIAVVDTELAELALQLMGKERAEHLRAEVGDGGINELFNALEKSIGLRRLC